MFKILTSKQLKVLKIKAKYAASLPIYTKCKECKGFIPASFSCYCDDCMTKMQADDEACHLHNCKLADF